MGDGDATGTIVTAVQDTVKWVGQIIADGKPNSSLPTQMANAVPKNDDWQTVTGAKGPNTIKLTLVTPGAIYGTNVDVEMHLNWDFGARYKGGGAFITNAWVTVPKCDVSWGFSVDLGFSPANPENRADDGKPTLACLPVTVSGTTSTTLRKQTFQWSYLLFGDGNWQKM